MHERDLPHSVFFGMHYIPHSRKIEGGMELFSNVLDTFFHNEYIHTVNVDSLGSGFQKFYTRVFGFKI